MLLNKRLDLDLSFIPLLSPSYYASSTTPQFELNAIPALCDMQGMPPLMAVRRLTPTYVAFLWYGYRGRALDESVQRSREASLYASDLSMSTFTRVVCVDDLFVLRISRFSGNATQRIRSATYTSPSSMATLLHTPKIQHR
ncbi:hypothetical protein SERLA73DRAFT_70686 [Serpula lacrymans var. lacrymans S7.3]|uniref:Uncharacterized protein n=1 Tax=Serpula lacrymans var. lacrymans (strain S7.3) TaxID=936435 RepID=F8PQ41_SERL3|nr:hypothetical protein SERLA73DRAFT_70686 [Serpula lacrymans var. lacrymans S7.3]